MLQKFGFEAKEVVSTTPGGIIVNSTSTQGIASTTSSTTVKSYTTGTKKPVSQTKITVEGVLLYTNVERVKYGLPPFRLSAKLSRSAATKVDDMFALEYFEHESPSGDTASDLVRREGYNFQSVGENLALGDFGSDKKLVEAWMNSPLHRKNILNPKFTDMGVGARRAVYKNDLQWLAVQHFGKLIPDCAEVSSTMKGDIDAEKKALEIEEIELQSMANQIESDPEQNTSREYLDAYNARVAKYNARLGALRDMIKEYNTKVEAYNSCISAA